MGRATGIRSCIGSLLLCAWIAGCASAGGRRDYSRLVVEGERIREDGWDTAYEALTHHTELIVFEDRIGFRGGDDRSGRGAAAQTYTVPLLVVDGNVNQGDVITTLRRIPAEEIVRIRLYHASMVPPEYRRPGAEGGVIEVTTR